MAKKIIAKKSTAKKPAKKKAVKKTVAGKKALKKKMMPKMMGSGEDMGGMMEMMPKMMMQMMPQCLKMMLPNIPKEKRIGFVMKMIDTLMEQGCVGLSNKEKKDFMGKITKKLR